MNILFGLTTAATITSLLSAANEQQILVPSRSAMLDAAGRSVVTEHDLAVFGAPGVRRVYVFARDETGEWVEEQALSPSVDNASFGRSLAMLAGTLFVGASDRVFVFRDVDGVWTETQVIFGASDVLFGRAIALSGDTAVIGAAGTDDTVLGEDVGAAFVYRSDADGNWSLEQELSTTTLDFWDFFGSAVDIDGDTAVVTAVPSPTGVGRVHVFERSSPPPLWVETAVIPATEATDPPSRFGQAVALEADTLLVGGTSPISGGGSAHVFVADELGQWSEQQRLDSTGPRLTDYGWAVGLAESFAVVTANDSASLFERDDAGLWTELELLEPTPGSDDNRDFGASVDLHVGGGLVALIGAPGAVNPPGQAYVFSRNRAAGTVCVDPRECTSGSCVDGVCCETECGGGLLDDCQACSVAAGAALDGVCGPVPDATACDDGDPCTEASTCEAGTCVPGPSVCGTDTGSETTGATGADTESTTGADESTSDVTSGATTSGTGENDTSGAGVEPSGEEGCGCRRHGHGGGWMGLLGIAVLVAARRRE